MKTLEHFITLSEVYRQEGILSAIRYDSKKTFERVTKAYNSIDADLKNCPLILPEVRLHHIIIGNLVSLGVLGAAYAIYSYFSKI